jgi:hypothetical protein
MAAISRDLIVSSIGDTSPVTVKAARVSASSVISDSGSLSATIPRSEAEKITEPVAGKWVSWPAWDWGGRIEDYRWDAESLEIGCKGFGDLLNDRIVPRSYQTITVPPGAHLRRLIQSVEEADGLIGLLGFAIDEDGAPIVITARLESLGLDVLPGLLDQGHEWVMSANRVLTFRRHIGVDRTASVILDSSPDGHIVGNPSVSGTIRTLANDVIGVGGAQRGWSGMQVRETNVSSVSVYGLRQFVTVFKRLITRHARRNVRPLARAALAQTSKLTEVPKVAIRDKSEVFAKFGTGDTVRIRLGALNRDVSFRVMARSLGDDGVMNLTGYVDG